MPPARQTSAEQPRTDERPEAAAEEAGKVAYMATDAALRSAGRFAEAFGLAGDEGRVRDAVHRSTQNMDSIAQCYTAVATGFQEILTASQDHTRARIEHAVDSMRALGECRTFFELGAAQSDIMRQAVEDSIGYALAVAETSVKVARTGFERCHAPPSGSPSGPA
jgi:hypothetical protein